MADTKAAISIDDLSKRYGSSDKFAVKKLSLQVMPGEVYGFLGPNGAGKSTTIRMLMNFIQPTKGSAQILGHDVVKDSVTVKQDIGYLSGDVELYPKMTGKDFLEYMAQLQPSKSKTHINDLAKRFKANLNVKIRDLSKGNRQKIGLLQALMAQPKVLILDEPTSGLDPLMQEEFFKVLKETTESGGCVFVSSHNLAEVQRICDRIGFIREGELIAEQNIAQITQDAARTFDIFFVDKVPVAQLKSIPKSDVKVINPKQASVSLRGDLSPLFKVLARHKVAGINQREINLEEEFLNFYKEDK
jgi:ABC-2 type transport system ATP-binding protein